MSNLHDVPLAEPENIPTTEQNLTGTKTNSLKRFFKLGKKSISTQNISEGTCEPEDDGTKDASKSPGSISRFLTRLKGTSKSDPSEPNSSSVTCLDEAHERPAPNPKLNLKTSISSYWKVLFNRQKAAARQGGETEQQSGLNDEMTEMQQVQQGQQTDPVKFDDVATIVTPKTSFHDLTANTVDIEEVHMLPISNETTVSPLQKKMKD